MAVSPITPADVPVAKAATIPDEVFVVWNAAIANAFSAGRACIRQDDIVERISAEMGVTRAKIFSERWLDIEEVYEAAGWKVVYDKPAFNESYPASFTFTPKE